MKTNRRYFLLISGLLLFASAACSFSATTANIKEAYTARDVDGSIQAATTFAPEDVFYCLVTVANAPDDTVTKAVWKTVEAEGVEADMVLLETEFEGGGEITFEASNEYLWPVGTYKVELYIDDKLEQTLECNVAGAASGTGSTGEMGTTDDITVDTAYMARFVDEDPEQVTSYAADEVFFCVVQLTGAESDTKVTAIWTAVDAEGVDANFEMNQAEMVGESLMTFNLSNENDWPAGSYMVEIYINDVYQGYLDFTVE